MPKLPANYTVRCIEGVDQSMTAETFIDRFQIIGDGLPLFTISFNYESDGHQGDCDARLCRLTELKPEELPFVCNGFQLIGKLRDWLDEQLTQDGGEFYAGCFVDGDTGAAIDLPIDFYH